MTQRERKLIKIMVAPMLKGIFPLPTFAEWVAAFDELYPPRSPEHAERMS